MALLESLLMRLLEGLGGQQLLQEKLFAPYGAGDEIAAITRANTLRKQNSFSLKALYLDFDMMVTKLSIQGLKKRIVVSIVRSST